MTHEEKDIIKPATAIQKVIKSLFSKKQFHHSNIVIIPSYSNWTVLQRRPHQQNTTNGPLRPERIKT